MIEVLTFNRAGRRIDCGEADDEQAALAAARALWDDSVEHGTGVRSVSFYVNGTLIRSFGARP